MPRKQEEIFAIQVSGSKVDRPFYGINIGDDENKLIATFGKPDTILAQDFYDQKAATWKYIKLNLSVLFTNSKIESIRIWDDYKVMDDNPPSVEALLKIIKTNDRSKIADILSPTLEITYCDNIISWKNSFLKDIYMGGAGMVEFITNNKYGLVTLGVKRNVESVLNLRAVEGVGVFPVYKFPKETLISEIVLNYQQGKYKIWEIKYKCDN